MTDGESVVNVAEYTSALRRWWMMILLCGALGAALGTVLLGLRTSLYASEARVEVRPLIVEGDSPNTDTSRQVNLTTERAIAGSQRVAERALALLAAADELGIDDLDDPAVEEQASRTDIEDKSAIAITKDVLVTIPTDSNILVISVENKNREQARETTEAVAYAYLDVRREAGLAATAEAFARLEASEAQLLTELDELAIQISQTTSESELRALSYRDISKKEQLTGIGASLATLSVIGVDPGYVIDDAALADSASGIPSSAGPISGALLGLSGGAAVAYFLDRRDDRFRSVGSELTGMDLHLLGSVPVGRGLFSGGSVIAQVGSPVSESYRRVQVGLLFTLDQADKSVIMVTGTDNPHSTSTVAANIAVAAARAGRRTLLVGVDLRRPSLHDRFEIENGRGLTDVVSGAATLHETLVTPIESTDLQLLTSGTPVDQPARLLQGNDFGRFVGGIRSDYDLVVLEAPPILQVADAADIALLCDGVVLVVEPGRTGRSAVSEAIQQLHRVGAEVVGTIVAESSRT